MRVKRSDKFKNWSLTFDLCCYMILIFQAIGVISVLLYQFISFQIEYLLKESPDKQSLA